jgi:hypothetical protein
MQDTAENEARIERHDEALNPGLRELEESRRYEAGDELGFAQIAEERCFKLEPFVVN